MWIKSLLILLVPGLLAACIGLDSSPAQPYVKPGLLSNSSLHRQAFAIDDQDCAQQAQETLGAPPASDLLDEIPEPLLLGNTFVDHGGSAGQGSPEMLKLQQQMAEQAQARDDYQRAYQPLYQPCMATKGWQAVP